MRPLLIGLNCASEQYSATDLVSRGMSAHESGFDSYWVSDHFHPWFHTDAHSAFAWEVLAAMAVKSERLVLGTSVTVPVLRYNPAIVAQAFSTLSLLAPGRIFLGLGTGEALNEAPCGYDWPASHAERLKRLREAIVIIRLLWTTEFVSFKGEYSQLRSANLYDKPKTPVPVHVSGFGPRAAELAGELGDAFMTVGPVEPARVMDVLLPAVERGARASGRHIEDVEKSLLLGIGFDADRDKAIDALLPWRGSTLRVFYDVDIHDPRYIEEHGKKVGREAMEKSFFIATSSDEVISMIERQVELGFDHIGLAASGDFVGLMKAAKEKILPYLREEYKDRTLSRTGYRGTYTTENLEQLLEAKNLADKVRL